MVVDRMGKSGMTEVGRSPCWNTTLFHHGLSSSSSKLLLVVVVDSELDDILLLIVLGMVILRLVVLVPLLCGSTTPDGDSGDAIRLAD